MIHTDLLKDEVSVYYAALYLKYQLERYPNDLRCAISGYNAGKCIKSNQKTYVDKVMARLKILNERTGDTIINPVYKPGVAFTSGNIPFRPIPETLVRRKVPATRSAVKGAAKE